MRSELDFITVAEAARLIAARQLSPVELTRAKLEQIEAIDPQVNAFITVTADLALRQAQTAEAEIAGGRYRGPLHGIPFALKDIYATAGILTSAHSKVCIDNIPREDAGVTARLRTAGGVLLGKLAMTEFAHGAPSFDAPWPPARNPWNPVHYTGGSSSGSGAAVAAGLALCAMGSDTGGSVRTPAAFCGTVGLKPTYGLVSRYGVIPNSYTFDHCGPLTWTVEDCAIMLQAVAGYDPHDGGSASCPIPDYRAALKRDLRGLRVGVVRHFWEEDLKTGEEIAQAMEAALDVLRQLGARVRDARMRPLQEYLDVKMTIAETEIFCVHRKELIARPGDFGMHFLAQTLAGCLFTASDYVQAQRERRLMLAEMEKLYQEYDVLVTASSGPAPRFDRVSILKAWVGPNIYTAFSVAGGPCMAICNGFTRDGLPLSMQIAGRPFDDATVLGVAHAYELTTPWRARRPALVAGAPRVPVTPPPCFSGVAVDEATRKLAEEHARRAGLKLNDVHLALLCEVAPYAFAMAQRVRRDHARGDEPCNVFRFPQAA
ncbi:MAG: amidase [Betaproteobacteria bacterium]|nr:amidase [Betaproteobacteria bacterium]